MKFDNLIKKTYYLLEQDQQPPEKKADMEDAAQTLDKAGRKMESQVETVQDELVDLIKRLVEALITESRAENIKLTPSIIEVLKDIRSSTLLPKPIEALSRVEELIDKMTSEYEKPVTGI